ncbi:RNA polymerase sigma factor [Leifsonia shinshuensis]|uniref:RNA polymerase sigma-70 factor (ECF subfamily) n=1 Tax=Leifsonia shinshuensis TaxID=150026 RepID=A0A853CWY3_9MICO|nr:RNA polymerase sigma factor [Leifsonia shinshuensis]NYJ24433.1 RNA polymerase sigma-70 factor (ECF subfamily) [Leifsonia shinshuensis]
MDGLTDAELRSRVRAGDGAAFGVVYDRHVHRVFGLCRRAADSVDAADDLTALVFLEAWRNRSRVRIVNGSIIGWLLVTAGYVARNHARAERRYRRYLTAVPTAEHVPDPSDEVLHRLDVEARTQRVQRAITRLSARDQEVLTLCVLEELPLADVSGVLRVPLGTVKSRLSRAKARLAQLLSEPAGDQPARTVEGGI